MEEGERGSVIVDAVSEAEVEDGVLLYLGKLLTGLTQDEIKAQLREPPGVLIKDVSSQTAAVIISDLEGMGVKARFVPTPGPAEVPPDQTPPPTPLSGPPSDARAPGDVPRAKNKRVWILAALGIVVVAAALLASRHFFPAPRSPVSSSPRIAGGSADAGKVVFSGMQPLSIKVSSVREAPPERMYDAFFYQYRMRPDQRFVRAFERLAAHYSQLRGDKPDAPRFKIGEAVADGKKLTIPLLKRSWVPFIKRYTKAGEISLPLPTTFAQARDGLSQLLAKMARGDKSAPAPKPSAKNIARLDAAIRHMNAIDPRFVAAGLNVLEELWRDGQKDAAVLKAAAGGYGTLLMTLGPDMTPAADLFASEALAFLTLAQWKDPAMPLGGEEARIARNMGYRAHATAVLAKAQGQSAGGENALFEAYLRQDIETLKRLRDQDNKGILGYYLLARLYREMGLSQDAQDAAAELIRQFPASYPAAMENIYSGDLDLAKVLTILYPLDIMGRLEASSSAEALETLTSWDERVKGFAGEESTKTISLSRFEGMLNHWSPYGKDRTPRFIIDEQGLKGIYRGLYANAVYLRFEVLFKRWAVMEAAETYTRSFSEDGKEHPLALLMQGTVLARSGDQKSAGELMSRVIGHPASSGYLVYKAFCALNKPLEKIKLLPEAADRLDGRPYYRLLMGWLFQKDIHDYDMAGAFYASGLADDPYQYWAHYEAARVSGSEEPLLKALEKFPRSFTLLELGSDYMAEKKDRPSKEKALAFLKTANDLAPLKSSITTRTASVLTDLGQYADAVAVLTRWIDQCGRGDVLALSAMKARRANVYLKMGNPRKALASLGKDVDLAKGDVMLVIARAYEDGKQIIPAAEQYGKILERYPAWSGAMARAAGFEWRRGEDERAAALIAKGRKIEAPFSRWYLDEFASSLKGAKDDRIVNAVEALRRSGATMWEMAALGRLMVTAGKPELALRMIAETRGASMMEGLENRVRAYKILCAVKGKDAASAYLSQNMTAQQKPPLMAILYKDGLNEEILAESGDPDSYPPQVREFMWLQRLIAWLALDKLPGGLAQTFDAHFKQASKDPYHALGRYLLGMLPQDALLKEVKTPQQRCEFAYYLGLGARVRGAFPEAASWYRICLETLLQNNAEFHWAGDELFWWAHMGTANRHRALKDDIAAYHEARGL